MFIFKNGWTTTNRNASGGNSAVTGTHFKQRPVSSNNYSYKRKTLVAGGTNNRIWKHGPQNQNQIAAFTLSGYMNGTTSN